MKIMKKLIVLFLIIFSGFSVGQSPDNYKYFYERYSTYPYVDFEKLTVIEKPTIQSFFNPEVYVNSGNNNKKSFVFNLIISRLGYVKYVTFNPIDSKQSDNFYQTDAGILMGKLKFKPSLITDKFDYYRTSVIVNYPQSNNTNNKPDSYTISSAREDVFDSKQSHTNGSIPVIEFSKLKLTNNIDMSDCYPLESRNNGDEGTISYTLIIDEKGIVENVEYPFRGTNRVLGISGRNCLYKYQFQPYMIENTPSTIKTNLIVKFNLGK